MGLAVNTHTGTFISHVADVTGLKNLQFSACGKYLLYEEQYTRSPQTIPLLDFGIYRAAIGKQEVERNHKNSVTSIIGNGPQAQVVKQHVLPKSLLPNQIVRHENGEFTKLSFSPCARARGIDIIHTSNRFEERQTLLTVPAWDDVKNVSVSMRAQTRARERKITLILNKSAPPINTISFRTRLTGPAITTKDIRAIPKSKVIGGSNKGSSWSGVHSNNIEDSNEDFRDRKKSRVGET